MTQAVAVRRPDNPAPVAPGTPVDPAERLRSSARNLLTALVDMAARAALRKVDDLAGSLEEATARGGAGMAAALGAGKAFLAGTNPVWGAVKAGFGALGALAKTLVVVGLALAPVLLIVLAVLLLVAALVLAIVLAIRAATR